MDRWTKLPSVSACWIPPGGLALDAIRDRMDANHRELLRTIGALAASVEKRLDALETAVARLDERIKNLAVAADVSRR